MKILIAVDFSEQCKRVIEAVLQLAKPERDNVELIHVSDRTSVEALTTMMVPLDLSVMESTCSEEMSNALKMLRGYADQFKAVSIPCEVHVYAGDPKKVITEQAEKMKANMIAMGFHTKTAIRALVLGSTSEYVTKHAHDAYVLIVK